MRAAENLGRLKGRSGTKPGTLLKSQIPIRTWADWDDAVPGFVEIDCVGHEGGDPSGDFCQTLTVTDIRTGWTQTQAVKSKAEKAFLRRPARHLRCLPVPDQGHRLGQRQRVHQLPPAALV